MELTRDPFAGAAAFDFLEVLGADRREGRHRELVEYLQMFPEHQERIAQEFLLAAGSSEEVSASTASHTRTAGQFVAGYLLKRILGSGGQGTVYLAEDTRLGREVALKLLPSHLGGLDSIRIQRLQREAALLARLDHPGVCAVYEADVTGARPFIAMRFVPGDTLAARLQQAVSEPQNTPGLLLRMPRNAHELSQVLILVERAALALQAAHAAGIIHRDVKPANIMIDRDEMPVLLDFGLARAVADAQLSLTMTGELFGTIAYMSPEQLAGLDVNEGTDIYSLGIVLQECLTLVSAFPQATHSALVQAIRNGERRDPRGLNHSVSRELSIVIAKATERDSDRRYATAREFADDLANVRERRPIRARPASVRLRLTRWSQRHPWGSVSLGLLVAFIGAMGWSLSRLSSDQRHLMAWQDVSGIVQRSEDRPAEALWDMVEAAKGEESQPQINAALHTALFRSLEAWRITSSHSSDGDMSELGADVLTSRMVIDRTRDLVLFGSSTGRLIAFDAARGSMVERSPPLPASARDDIESPRSLPAGALDNGICALELSPDGLTLVCGTSGGELILLPAGNLAGPRAHVRLGAESKGVSSIVFDRTGRWIAAGSNSGTIWVLRLDEGVPPKPIDSFKVSCHQGPVADLSFSDDGKFLLSLGIVEVIANRDNPQLFVWDLEARTSCFSLEAATPDMDMPAACWVNGGHQLAVANKGGAVRVYSSGNWNMILERKFAGQIMWIGNPSTTNELTVCDIDGVWLLDLLTLSVRLAVASSHDRPFQRAVVSPDGELVAIIVQDATVRIFERNTWHEVAILRKHSKYVAELAWSSDSRMLVTSSMGLVHGWHILASPYMSRLCGHDGRVRSVDFSPDCETVVTAGEDGTVRFWSRNTATETGRALLPAPRASVCYSPSGKYVLTVGETNDAHIVRHALSSPVLALTGHQAKVTKGGFVAVDGAELALTVSQDGEARLWNPDNGAPVRSFAAHDRGLSEFAVDADRGWLATGDIDGRVDVFDVATSEHIRVLDTAAEPPMKGIHGACRGLLFLPRTGRLCSTAQQSPATLWDPSNEWRRSEIYIGGATGCVATDPSERWLALGELSVSTLYWVPAEDLTVLVHQDGKEPTSWFSRIAVRAQGDIGLVASLDGSIWLYDWMKRDVYSVLRCEHGSALDARFSPDGRWVAGAYHDGTVVVWPVEPFPMAERFRCPIPH